MNDKNWEIFESVTSKEILISNFLFASFYISVYEAIKNDICDKVKNFYCLENLRIKNGKIISKSTDDYKRDILDVMPDGKHNNTFFASLLWLKDGEALNNEEYDFIFKIVRNTRNNYTHNLFELLFQKPSIAKHDELKRFLFIYKKINIWWATNIDGFPKDSENCFNLALDAIYSTLFNSNK